MKAGEKAVHVIRLSNNGTSTITVKVEAPTCYKVDATVIDIPPGGTAAVEVTLDTTGLAPAFYENLVGILDASTGNTTRVKLVTAVAPADVTPVEETVAGEKEIQVPGVGTVVRIKTAAP